MAKAQCFQIKLQRIPEKQRETLHNETKTTRSESRLLVLLRGHSSYHDDRIKKCAGRGDISSIANRFNPAHRRSRVPFSLRGMFWIIEGRG